MKTLLPFLLLGLLTLSARATEPDDQLPPAPEGKSWKLVWHDEFDGDKLDGTKWEVPNNRRRDGWWSPKAVSLDGQGHLAISTLKEGDRYLDACVRTRGRFEHSFGYYVAESEAPKGTRPLVGVLALQFERRQDRQRGPGWDGDRHHGEAVAG